jgi:hypothetical protein
MSQCPVRLIISTCTQHLYYGKTCLTQNESDDNIISQIYFCHGAHPRHRAQGTHCYIRQRIRSQHLQGNASIP